MILALAILCGIFTGVVAHATKRLDGRRAAVLMGVHWLAASVGLVNVSDSDTVGRVLAGAVVGLAVVTMFHAGRDLVRRIGPRAGADR